ncbi:MAG: L,D-transpeptidase family protein [Rhodospirillaceae bacterium]|nr:L,D-transpeptidase family protein [Rhodospirillales bacterium]
MSFARPFLFSLALALASAGSLAYADTPVDVQRRLEDATGIAKIGDRTIDLAPLKDFYRQRSYRLAWSGSGEATAARLLMDLQAIALAEGLVPETYGVPATGSDIEHDILVSDALARFGRDLATGRVSPSRLVGGMGPESRPAFETDKFLRDLAGGKELITQATALPPAYAGYHRLRQAMEKYRELVRAGGWTAIADGPSIKPGNEDDRVPMVRKRLIASGELEAKHDKGKLLDGQVSAALKRFQLRHGIEADGAVGKATLAALNVSADERLRQIQANMERWRWMPRALDSLHIAVNLPAAHLELVKNGEIQMAMRVVVGDVKHQTPSMVTTMTSVVLNPTWTVPPSIATKEILPKLRKDPNYLSSNNMHILEAFPEGSPQAQGVGLDWHKYSKFPWRIRQAPGPDNALGQVKFNLSNQDDIYLHDTPRRQYFGRLFRALSHGCVRVERPVQLAQALVSSEWAQRIDDLIIDANTKTLKLEKPLTVYLMYMTTWADEDGTINFRDDLYGHDGRLKAALKRPRTPTAQVAQDRTSGAL